MYTVKSRRVTIVFCPFWVSFPPLISFLNKRKRACRLYLWFGLVVGVDALFSVTSPSFYSYIAWPMLFKWFFSFWPFSRINSVFLYFVNLSWEQFQSDLIPGGSPPVDFHGWVLSPWMIWSLFPALLHLGTSPLLLTTPRVLFRSFPTLFSEVPDVISGSTVPYLLQYSSIRLFFTHSLIGLWLLVLPHCLEGTIIFRPLIDMNSAMSSLLVPFCVRKV